MQLVLNTKVKGQVILNAPSAKDVIRVPARELAEDGLMVQTRMGDMSLMFLESLKKSEVGLEMVVVKPSLLSKGVLLINKAWEINKVDTQTNDVLVKPLLSLKVGVVTNQKSEKRETRLIKNKTVLVVQLSIFSHLQLLREHSPQSTMIC